MYVIVKFKGSDYKSLYEEFQTRDKFLLSYVYSHQEIFYDDFKKYSIIGTMMDKLLVEKYEKNYNR